MNGNGVIRSGYPFGWGAYESTLVRGDGMYVFDQNGKRYLDLCSGLWNMPLGYSERRIKAMVNKQMEQLPFSNLLVFSSDIQTQYAQRLLQWMGDFGCVLYTCSGSESVEAAIKTCRQYQCLRNRPERRRIAAFTLSYHGTSYGAMSVSGIDQILTDVYRPLVPEICWVSVPADYENEEAWLQAIDGLWEREGDYLAGFIVEPVMASGGVVPIPTPVLQHIQQRCRERDVLLVADEVATGFGRTGTPFAWQQAELSPDLVCLSKAINNGYLPLGVLVFSQSCADLFAEQGASLEHFSTQGGNGVAVAAAMGMLDCMKEYDQFHVKEKGQLLLNRLREGLEGRASVRGLGLMAAVDFPKRFDSLQMLQVVELFKKRGILVYIYNNEPVNKGISFFPSFLITEEELERCVQKVLSILRRLL